MQCRNVIEQQQCEYEESNRRYIYESLRTYRGGGIKCGAPKEENGGGEFSCFRLSAVELRQSSVE